MAARRTAAAGLISNPCTLQLALFGLVALGAPAVLAQRRMPAPVPSAPAPQTLQPAPQASSPTPLPAPTTLPVVPPGAATPPPSPARLNTGLVTIESDLQRADQSTGVVTATGNVRIVYPDQRVVATARQAQYFSREGRVVLSGDVDIVQEGGSLLRAEQVLYLVDRERLIAIPTPGRQVFSRVRMPQQTAGTAPGMQQP